MGILRFMLLVSKKIMYLSECQSLCAVLEGLSLVWVLILIFLSQKGCQTKQVCIISRYFSSYKIPLKPLDETSNVAEPILESSCTVAFHVP